MDCDCLLGKLFGQVTWPFLGSVLICTWQMRYSLIHHKDVSVFLSVALEYGHRLATLGEFSWMDVKCFIVVQKLAWGNRIQCETFVTA